MKQYLAGYLPDDVPGPSLSYVFLAKLPYPSLATQWKLRA